MFSSPRATLGAAAIVLTLTLAILSFPPVTLAQGQQRTLTRSPHLGPAQQATPPAGTPAQGSTPAPAGTPAARGTGTAGPQPTATPATADANDYEGTVAGVAGDDLTVRTRTQPLLPVPVPTGVPVVRNGQPSSLDVVEGGDRVIIQRDPNGTVRSVIALAPPATPAPSPTAAPQPTGARPATTGTAAAAATPGAGPVVGSVTEVRADGLTVDVNGAPRTVSTAGVQGLTVTRNGNPTQLNGIRTGDNVTVTFGPNNRPSEIAATSAAGGAGPNLTWLLYLLPLLTVLLVPYLLLFFLRRRRRDPFIVERQR